MTSEPNSDSPLELAHVLFTDIVGYSKLLGNQQREHSSNSTESFVVRASFKARTQPAN